MAARIHVVGDQVPPLGNAFTRWLGRLVLAIYEWRIEGTVPNRPKFLVAIAPHTSIWDFVFAFATMLAIGEGILQMADRPRGQSPGRDAGRQDPFAGPGWPDGGRVQPA